MRPIPVLLLLLVLALAAASADEGPLPCSIGGTVRLADTQSRAVVQVSAEQNGVVVAGTTTAPGGGEYRLEDLTAGRYLVWARAEGYVSAHLHVVLSTGEQRNSLDFVPLTVPNASVSPGMWKARYR